jgi:hypothetical protein
MRRIFIIAGSMLVVASFLLSETMFAGSAQEKGATEQSSKAPSHAAKARHSGTSSRKKGAKRRAYRPEYKQNAVEVINGSTTRRVVFDDKKTTETAKNQPLPLKVEVLNGNAADTRYFYVDKNHPQEQAVNSTPERPVVVGVESSSTRVAGGNRHPVVTAITDANSADASMASQSGQKLTTGVSPQPKRPPYQPK